MTYRSRRRKRAIDERAEAGDLWQSAQSRLGKALACVSRGSSRVRGQPRPSSRRAARRNFVARLMTVAIMDRGCYSQLAIRFRSERDAASRNESWLVFPVNYAFCACVRTAGNVRVAGEIAVAISSAERDRQSCAESKPRDRSLLSIVPRSSSRKILSAERTLLITSTT